jgi:dihydroorotase
MELTLQGGMVYENGQFEQRDVTVSVDDGTLLFPTLDCTNRYIFPGFADVHVHLREPGFSYKETVKSGTMAGARGGYTALCSMPNLKPTPDSLPHLREQLAIIARDASVAVSPYGTITVGEMGETMADLEAMAPYVCGFSDDGRGVQDKGMMREAMLRAKALGKVIAAHCEENSLLQGGYIHKGRYAAAHGHRGICSESEWRPIARDLEMVAELGCAYHVCHISTKESVALIREAKKSGVNVTCETGPHYLTLCEDDLQEHGRFKMNPPLRAREDKEALIEGILDGTIDMIATDHAPHSAEEKGRGLEKSAMGVVGLETAFAVLYTDLVKTGILPLERLVALLSEAPRKRFGLTTDVGFAVFDLDTPYAVDPAEFLSQGKATPFEGKTVYGKCLMTVYDGKIVYRDAQGLRP